MNLRDRGKAFALIEVIGVLAVLSVLALVLVPKVFEAINNARLGAVPMGLRTIKTASVEHCARYNSMAVSNGVTLTFSGTYDGFDRVLLAEGLIDKPLATRVGTNAIIRLVDVSSLTASSDPLDKNTAGAYDLDGDGKNDIVGAHYLLEAVFEQPTRADVAGINNLLDGPTLSFQTATDDDRKGMVIYQDSSNNPNPHANPNASKHRAGVMYIYIMHR